MLSCSSLSLRNNWFTRLQISRLLSSATTPHSEEELKCKKRVIFSGIQPTGTPHVRNIFLEHDGVLTIALAKLGNYLGALSNWVKIQEQAHPKDILIFSIAGWHALTLPQDPKILSKSRLNMVAALLAIGINPERSILFHQDDNQDHAELAWIFNCITPVSELNRMTTWKSKLATSRNTDNDFIDDSKLNTGLYAYPVLQAADILIYRTTHVPVGEDQTQHVELCRKIARIYNRKYKTSEFYFPSPSQMNTSHRRILSLKDPTSKMSKSSLVLKSRVNFTDEESEIYSKIRSAVTDTTFGVTYDPVRRPGVSNLISILAACTGEDPNNLATVYENKGHQVLKEDVAYSVNAFLENPRSQFKKFQQDEGYLREVAKYGAQKAKAISASTVRQVRSQLGLV